MHNHDEHHHHHDHGHDSDDLAEMLDLDAEVLRDYLPGAIGWVRELAAEPTGRIVDLGAGTGTGTLALAERFPDAEVIAVDASAAMLERLTAKARSLGIDRIQPVQADLDAGWPDLGPVDLVWASNSMHHMADPDRVLSAILRALTPGGLLAVAELDSFPRFLPDEDLGSGVEARCAEAMVIARGADMPHLGSDWGPRLAKAGFTVEAERQFVLDVTAPLPPATGRYAQASLRRMRTGLDALSDADRAALDRLIDGPESVLHRDDLRVRAERTVWAARRV
jgi:SAM-dependent methyltransferase